MSKIMEKADAYPDEKTIEVDYWDIDFFDSEFGEYLLLKPYNSLYNAEQAIHDLLPADAMERDVKLHFRVVRLPEETAKIGIRLLRAEHLGKFVAIDGLVRKTTEVRPMLREAVFQCLRCYAILKVSQESTVFKEPMECSKEQGGCGRAAASTAFKLLTEKSQFIDTQKLEVQESPEELRAGAQPERLTIYVEDDLTGLISPGDRVIVNGVLRSQQRVTRLRGKSTLFDIFLECNSLELKEKEFEDVKIKEEEIKEFIEISKKPNVYEVIIESIAPSIYGMPIEKEALALQLFSGVQKHMPDETKIRGDIHILLVGDPGTAKSQLLEYVSHLSPRGVYASGKSTSAAGLTAAAVRDEFGEGRWVLEAGALVLADGGIACIDEIDKMSSQDRSALHEAMEQQEIHVAKAGITAALKSRCSLLAAANPKYGRFDEYRPISEQIDMPPALLSRFDVIFPIKDKPEKTQDLSMAEHILRSHVGGEIKQHRSHSHAPKFTEDDEKDALKNIEPILTQNILKKYVAYARRNVYPVMTRDAIQDLADFYVQLRTQEGSSEGTAVAITPRQLEGLVRLAEASARIRLSEQITSDDTDRAIRITRYFLSRVASAGEGGGFDIDIIATGTGHSQRTRMIRLIEIIRDISERDKSGNAYEDDVIDEAEAAGLDRDQITADIEKLRREGRIFKPSEKRIRLV
jgi:replicative DNA helicase Mcm